MLKLHLTPPHFVVQIGELLPRIDQFDFVLAYPAFADLAGIHMEADFGQTRFFQFP
jgi:hypothetical protein